MWPPKGTCGASRGTSGPRRALWRRGGNGGDTEGGEGHLGMLGGGGDSAVITNTCSHQGSVVHGHDRHIGRFESAQIARVSVRSHDQPGNADIQGCGPLWRPQVTRVQSPAASFMSEILIQFVLLSAELSFYPRPDDSYSPLSDALRSPRRLLEVRQVLS